MNKANKGGKKKDRSMNDVSAGYEQFIEGKEQIKGGKALFSKVIKRLATSKPHDSK